MLAKTRNIKKSERRIIKAQGRKRKAGFISSVTHSLHSKHNLKFLGQESCYDKLSLQQRISARKLPDKLMKTIPKSSEFFMVEQEARSPKSSFLKEENVKIYQKLMRISSKSNNDPESSLKTKSKSNEKEHIVVSEEEFFEINNIERDSMGYLINDYFDTNYNEETLINKKQEMKRQAEKLHHEHRVRIHEFYDKSNQFRSSEPSNLTQKRSLSVRGRLRFETALPRLPDYFSKYDLNFIHLDLMVNDKKTDRGEERLYSAFDEEKCLKKIMKIYKDNKTRFWIDNHHYNRVINKPSREKIHKPCCKKAEYGGTECHQIKYSLMTFYKFMEETLKDMKVYGRLWILSYDYYFKPENFLLEIIKIFFIPNPLFLSKNELKKFISYKILPRQKKILSLLTLWVEIRPEDFVICKNLGLLLKAFLSIMNLLYKDSFNEEIVFIKEKIMMDGQKNLMSSTIKKRKEQDQILILPAFVKGNQNHCHVLDLDSVRTLISHESAIFFSLDSDSLVQQFCLIDHEMYKGVNPYILSNNFKSPTNSGCLNKIIQRYNFLTYYFILTIILQKQNKEKVIIIMKLLEIAEKSAKYHNFQCLLTVCNALSHLLVLRFKKAWESLPPASKKLDEKIKDLVCFNKNYKKLRKVIKECKPPFIPCLNIILRDINQYDGDNEWVFLKDKEFVNLKKMEGLNDIIEQVILMQREKFNFERKPFYFEFFENHFQKILEYYVENCRLEHVEEKLFELSKNIENNG